MSLQTSQALKQLESRRVKLEEELKAVTAEADRVRKQQTSLRNDLNTIIRKINNLMDSNVVLTEHALLRYLERVQGMNLDEIKSIILDEPTKEQIRILGSGKFPKDGYTLVVKNNTIISIV